ncbi:restriction endonuclease subunit S [Lysinibacillus sp. RSDA_15]|uniref:restriction endonuclease subunit S n=1 Tax=Lysinibacillus sp. RSDA_15 TaxID=3391421 RepID=UPI003A4D9D39
MGLSLLNSKFSEISKSHHLFSSYNFHNNSREISLTKIPVEIRLGDLFDIISGYAFLSDDYVDEGTKLLRIGDIDKLGNINYHEMNHLPKEFKDTYKRFLLQEGDIVIAMTGATIGKTGLVINLKEDVLLNQRVGIIRRKSFVNEEEARFYYYLTKTDYFKKQILLNSMGKSQPNVSPYDILKVKVPKVNPDIQNVILETITDYEGEIEKNKHNVKDTTSIIDEVFLRYFNLNAEKLKSYEKEKMLDLSLSSFSSNIDLRCSFKFHNPGGVYATDSLISITNKKIKDFLEIPIQLGQGIKPAEFDEEGKQYYISMADIKTWGFNGQEAKFVTESYFKKYKKHKSLIKYDIVMARSGEGTIGKVALIKNDIDGIFADFVMRIRLKNYNKKFAYYYFRTSFFQYLIYTHKKGLGNNTNIFPSQIQELPILDVDEGKHALVVSEIDKYLSIQEEINKEIEMNNNQIKKVMDNFIKNLGDL